MKTDERDRNLIDDLNAVAVTEEELIKVINEVTLAQEVGICSMMTGWIAQKKLREKTPDKAEAILTRLQALTVMMENDDLNSWLLYEEARSMPAVAHRALVSAAADHPLSIINGDISFEKESFLRRILELAEPEGSHRN
jgi:hypothetical protein